MCASHSTLVGCALARRSDRAYRFFGSPGLISCDHGLGGDDTSMRVVKWLLETDLDSGRKFTAHDFHFIVHNANPVGRENIKGLLDSYLRSQASLRFPRARHANVFREVSGIGCRAADGIAEHLLFRHAQRDAR